MPIIRPAAAALAALFLTSTSPLAAQSAPPPVVPINVQVINDSGLPDSEVFLLLAGKDVTGAALTDRALPFYPFEVSGVRAAPAGTVTLSTGTLATNGVTIPAAVAPLAITSGASPLTMAFAPATVAVGGASTWTINVPNAAAAAVTLDQPLTAPLPTGVVTSGANTGTCTNVAITPSAVTLPAGQSVQSGGCTIVVQVQANALPAPSTATVVTSYLQSNANIVPAVAPLAVVSAGSTISAAFAPTTITQGDSATLTLTLPNATPSAVALTADFVATMPSSVVISPATAGGTCTDAGASANQVTLPAGASIPAGGCTIVVSVAAIASGGALSAMAPLQGPGGPVTARSPYSGQQRPVYTFSMSSVSSGNLYFSYKSPVAYPTAPTVAERYRFQSLEFSYSNAISSNGDLTSIDFYGIPLELQTFAPGDTVFQYPLDRVSYYTSTASLLKAFTAVDANLSYAFMRTDGAPFNPATDSFADFARIVGPNQLAAPGTSPIQWPPGVPAGYTGVWPPPQGSPWPYGSFADYLDSLVAANYTFVESDNAVISAYTFYYTGSIAGSRATGYTITLIGGSREDPTITLSLPPQDTAKGGFDFAIYGVPQNCRTLQVSGMDCTDANVASLTNSVYGWIQADVISALNFGYMSGTADASNGGVGQSSVWYGLPPVQFPFGQARATSDGYYNAWAALMYNHSDAYGFAFSDRKGRPSPDIAFPVGGTLRIWILPDTRLDAPLPKVIGFDSQSISLSWPVVADADHYVVTWSPPYTTNSQTVVQPPAGAGLASYQITRLTAGTPYTITVRAANADETQTSFEVPVYARTWGTPTAPVASNASANFGFNWTPSAIMQAQNPQLYVAGQTATYDASTSSWTTLAPVGIEVGLPPSTAALTVKPTQACSPPCITQSLSATTIAPGGSTTLSIVLTSKLTTNQITLPHGMTITLPAGVTAAPLAASTTCVGVSVQPTMIVVGKVQVITGASTCTIAATLTSSTPGTVIITTPVTTLDEGNAPATTQALTVTGGGAAVAQTFAPSTIEFGAASMLTISLPNTTDHAIHLTVPFIDIMPAGVTISGLANTTTCPAVSLVRTTQLTMGARAAIPPGGCVIVATVTSSTPGTVLNTTGTFETDATVYPTQAYPLELRVGDTVIWSANYYLTFLGSPQAYSAGSCLPGEACAGSGAATVVPFDTLHTPNFLERQMGGLTLSGGASGLGPPFAASNTPGIGLSFTPVANKKAAPVTMPVPASRAK